MSIGIKGGLKYVEMINDGVLEVLWHPGGCSGDFCPVPTCCRASTTSPVVAASVQPLSPRKASELLFLDLQSPGFETGVSLRMFRNKPVHEHICYYMFLQANQANWSQHMQLFFVKVCWKTCAENYRHMVQVMHLHLGRCLMVFEDTVYSMPNNQDHCNKRKRGMPLHPTNNTVYWIIKIYIQQKQIAGAECSQSTTNMERCEGNTRIRWWTPMVETADIYVCTVYIYIYITVYGILYIGCGLCCGRKVCCLGTVFILQSYSISNAPASIHEARLSSPSLILQLTVILYQKWGFQSSAPFVLTLQTLQYVFLRLFCSWTFPFRRLGMPRKDLCRYFSCFFLKWNSGFKL